MTKRTVTMADDEWADVLGAVVCAWSEDRAVGAIDDLASCRKLAKVLRRISETVVHRPIYDERRSAALKLADSLEDDAKTMTTGDD